MTTRDSEGSQQLEHLDGMSKKMLDLRRKLTAIAETATADDHKIVADFSRSGAGSRRMNITPAAAAIIVLYHNPLNRKLNMRKIEGLVQVILHGDWRATHHQGAAVNPAGDLGDGQHRLIAAALADTQIGILVTADVPFDDVLDVVDTGTTRTPGQALRMRGWERGEEVAPLAGRLAAYVHERLHGVKPQLPGLTVQRFARDNRKILEDALDISEKSDEQVAEAVMSKADSAMIAAVLLFDGWDYTQTASFIATVQQGLAPYDNAPTLPLERLLDRSNKANKSRDRLSPAERIALSVKCASLFQDRIGASKLSWNDKKEGLPTVRRDHSRPAAAAE